MEESRRQKFIEELVSKVPELKRDLVSITFGLGTGTAGSESETTRIRKGKGLRGKLFGKTLVKVEFVHCDGFVPYETLTIYDAGIEEKIWDSYQTASPGLTPDLEHGPKGRSRDKPNRYYFTYDREKYMGAFLKAGNVID